MLRTGENSQGISWLGWSVILIVAIVMGAMFLMLYFPGESMVPRYHMFNGYITNNSTTIHIYHLGGEPFNRGQNPGQFQIYVDGVDRTNSFIGPDPFTEGTNLSYNSSVMPKNVVLIYYLPEGGEEVFEDCQLLPCKFTSL